MCLTLKGQLQIICFGVLILNAHTGLRIAIQGNYIIFGLNVLIRLRLNYQCLPDAQRANADVELCLLLKGDFRAQVNEEILVTKCPTNQKGYKYFPLEQLLKRFSNSQFQHLCSGMGKWPNGNFSMSFRNKVLSHILGTGSGLYWQKRLSTYKRNVATDQRMNK